MTFSRLRVLFMTLFLFMSAFSIEVNAQADFFGYFFGSRVKKSRTKRYSKRKSKKRRYAKKKRSSKKYKKNRYAKKKRSSKKYKKNRYAKKKRHSKKYKKNRYAKKKRSSKKLSRRIVKGKKVLWQECQGTMMGSYGKGFIIKRKGKYSSMKTNFRCAKKGRLISQDHYNFLKNNLLSCVNSSLKKMGKAIGHSILLFHSGVEGNRIHKAKGLKRFGSITLGSYHNSFKAIDIRKIVVYQSNGQKEKFDYPHAVVSRKSKDRTFFSKLRNCFGGRHINRDNKCKYNRRRKKGGRVATIGWEDRGHRHHLHLSHPFCGRKRGYYKL